MRRIWTSEELELLKEKFPNTYTNELCVLFGRKYNAIATKAHGIGLKKSEEFKKKELQLQAEKLKILGSKYHFKKGQISHNKGQKMSKEQYDKCKQTFFKKGQLPHNTKYDGYERVGKDGYVEVRTGLGKFVFKHRLVYEQHYGKIPEGMVIIFKDNDKLNFSPENLQLMDRVALMNKNTIHRYPEDLQRSIKSLHKIQRLITKKNQEK